MRKIIMLTVLTIAINSNIFAQACLAEGIIFGSQNQIDNFQKNYPGCSIIEGNVTIDGGSNIINLNGLSGLNSINGSLNIIDNYSLASLSGLDSLITIGGNLILHTNTALSSLSGLENLESIGNWLVLTMNPNLISISGLENLSTIGEQLWIEYCNSLPNLKGLENLISIDGRLVISHNPSLNSLTGLENLNSINGYIEIWFNHELNSLTGLSGLNSINGGLYIIENDSLTSLDGLGNIDAATIQDLFIEHNPQLTYCAVQSICDYLAAPYGSIAIEDNQIGCNNQNQIEEACESVGLNDKYQIEDISFYPNPTSSYLFIESEKNALEIQVCIYNLMGQILFNKKLQSNKLDVTELENGVYIIELINNEFSHRQKLIIK